MHDPPVQVFVQVPAAHLNVHLPPEHEFTHLAPALQTVTQPPPAHVVVRVEPDWPTKSHSRPEQSYAHRSAGPHTKSQRPWGQFALHAPPAQTQFDAPPQALPVVGADSVPTVQS